MFQWTDIYLNESTSSRWDIYRQDVYFMFQFCKALLKIKTDIIKICEIRKKR